MRILLHITLLLCPSLLLIAGCKRGSIYSKEYYAGEFSFRQNTTQFLNCSTGEFITLNNDGYLPSLIEAYNNLPYNPDIVYIEFYGHRELPSIYRQLPPKCVVTIDTLINLSTNLMCHPSKTISGKYHGTSQDSVHYNVILGSDFSFSAEQINPDSSKQNLQGSWHQNSEALIVIHQNNPLLSNASFQWISTQETLVKNSGGKPLVFVKVYD